MRQVLGQGHADPEVRAQQTRPGLRRLLRRPHHRPRNGLAKLQQQSITYKIFPPAVINPSYLFLYDFEFM